MGMPFSSPGSSSSEEQEAKIKRLKNENIIRLKNKTKPTPIPSQREGSRKLFSMVFILLIFFYSF